MSKKPCPGGKIRSSDRGKGLGREAPAPKYEAPPNPLKQCKHDYEFLRSDYEKVEGPELNYYKQIDVFYCRKCLEYKKVTAKEEHVGCKPAWYKS